jgi:hypothetical protein
VTDPLGEPLDEATLRRALRLEADERPPVFDPAAIASAAGLRPRLAVVNALVAVGLGVFGAATVWSAVAVFMPTLLADAFAFGLGALALLAVPATGVADLVQQPVVPLSLVAALAIATAYELRERRIAVAQDR